MDRTIPPGQTEKVQATVSTGRRAAKMSKAFMILTNDRDNQRVSMVCVVQVLAAVKIEPAHARFPQIKRNAGSQTMTLTLTRGDGGPLDPKVTTTGSSQITAELREIEAGERYELDIAANPPWHGRVVRGNIVLETGVEQAPREMISAFGTIEPRLAALPQRFTIPRKKADADLELVAKLQWSDDLPGEVLEATVSDPRLSVQVEERDNQQVVALRIPAGWEPGQSPMIRVTLKTDDPTDPVLMIPAMINPPLPRQMPTTAPARRTLSAKELEEIRKRLRGDR